MRKSGLYIHRRRDLMQNCLWESHLHHRLIFNSSRFNQIPFLSLSSYFACHYPYSICLPFAWSRWFFVS